MGGVQGCLYLVVVGEAMVICGSWLLQSAGSLEDAELGPELRLEGPHGEVFSAKQKNCDFGELNCTRSFGKG